jgi:hypothetical protein
MRRMGQWCFESEDGESRKLIPTYPVRLRNVSVVLESISWLNNECIDAILDHSFC